MRNANAAKLQAINPKVKEAGQKSSLLGAAKTSEGLAGTKRKFQELEKFMSEDSDDYDEQIK